MRSLYNIRVEFKIRVVRLIRKLLKRFAPSVLAPEMGFGPSSEKSLALILHGLNCSRQPLDTINYLYGVIGIPDRVLWVCLTQLKGMASPNFKVISDKAEEVNSPDVRFKLYVNQMISFPIKSTEEIDNLIDHYHNIKGELMSAQSARGMLASLIVGKAPLNEVESKLQRLELDVRILTETQKIQLLGRLKSFGDQDLFLNWDNRLGPMGNTAELKKKQMQAELFGSGKEELLELEGLFLDLDFDISERYSKEIKPIFDSLPDHQNWTWAQYDDLAVNRIKNFMIEHVSEKKPLSYMRLNDGECYGFADNKYVDEHGVHRQELHWWGKNLDAPLRNEIISQFREAVDQSDLLGIPTVTRLIKDFNLTKRDQYPVNSILSRILCVMNGVEEFLNDKIIVEGQSNLFLFDDEFVQDLFTSADRVCVISGVDSQLVENWAPDTQKLECIEIPTHRLLRENVGTSVDGTLPDVYQNYIDEIKKRAAPGVLFLISAGFIGKIFISEAAKNGAVALDIGQTLVSSVQKRGSLS